MIIVQHDGSRILDVFLLCGSMSCHIWYYVMCVFMDDLQMMWFQWLCGSTDDGICVGCHDELCGVCVLCEHQCLHMGVDLWKVDVLMLWYDVFVHVGVMMMMWWVFKSHVWTSDKDNWWWCCCQSTRRWWMMVMMDDREAIVIRLVHCRWMDTDPSNVMCSRPTPLVWWCDQGWWMWIVCQWLWMCDWTVGAMCQDQFSVDDRYLDAKWSCEMLIHDCVMHYVNVDDERWRCRQ